jgi:hypothetical protein
MHIAKLALIVGLSTFALGCSKGACESERRDSCLNEAKSLECSEPSKFHAKTRCEDLGYGNCKGSIGQSTCKKKPGLP